MVRWLSRRLSMNLGIDWYILFKFRSACLNQPHRISLRIPVQQHGQTHYCPILIYRPTLIDTHSCRGCHTDDRGFVGKIHTVYDSYRYVVCIGTVCYKNDPFHADGFACLFLIAYFFDDGGLGGAEVFLSGLELLHV